MRYVLRYCDIIRYCAFSAIARCENNTFEHIVALLTEFNTENAILLTHSITICNLSELPQKPQYAANVGFYHPAIRKNAPNARPNTTQFAPVGYTDYDRPDFPKGAKVLIIDTVNAYAEFKQMSGVVQRTVKERNCFICVRFESEATRNAVKRLNQLPRNKARFNFLKQDELDLLCCRVGLIQLVTPQPTDGSGSSSQDKPADEKQDVTLAGKRQAPEDSTADEMSAGTALVATSVCGLKVPAC